MLLLFISWFLKQGRPGCAGACSVDQAGWKNRESPASESRVLGLKTGITVPSLNLIFKWLSFPESMSHFRKLLCHSKLWIAKIMVFLLATFLLNRMSVVMLMMCKRGSYFPIPTKAKSKSTQYTLEGWFLSINLIYFFCFILNYDRYILYHVCILLFLPSYENIAQMEEWFLLLRRYISDAESITSQCKTRAIKPNVCHRK